MFHKRFAPYLPVLGYCFIGLLQILMTTQSLQAAQPIQKLASNVYFVQDSSVPLLSLSIVIPGGSATDPASKAGLARMTMGMLDEGAGELESLAYQQALEDYAIRLDFSASRDILSINLQSLIEHKEKAAQLFTMALAKPRFDETAIARLKRQTLSQIAYKEQTPSQQVRELWWKTAFENHSYANPIEGTKESVVTLTQQDMQNFVKTHLSRDNLYIGLVGDLTAEEAKDWLNSILEALPENNGTSIFIEPVELPNGQQVTKPWPGKDAVAIFGQHGIARNDPDYYAAILLNYVLGNGGFDSRLMEEVREKRGLTYGVGTSLITAKAVPLLLGQVSSATTSIDEALRVIKDEWQKLASQGMTKEELQNAKDHENGSFYLGLDSTAKLADTLAAIQYHGLPIDYLSQREALINQVTLKQVNTLASSLLSADDLITAVVGKE